MMYTRKIFICDIVFQIGTIACLAFLLVSHPSCTTTPNGDSDPWTEPTVPPDPPYPEPEVTEDGYSIIPQKKTLKLVWISERPDWARIDLQILNKDDLVVWSLTVVEATSIPMYEKLMDLPPGKYKIRARLYKGPLEPDEWCMPYLFEKGWP